MSPVNDWDNEYARLARIASQLRSSSSAGNSGAATAADLQTHLSRLEGQLNSDTLLLTGLSQAEIQRRRRLVQHLQSGNNNSGSAGGSYSAPSSLGAAGGQAPQQQAQQMSQMQMAMRQQDDMIDNLAVGIGRLRDQTQLIGDEARMHVNLLGDMEGNLEEAHQGLESETRRAARLREDQSVWRLQLTVAGLSVLLVLLILMGIS